MKKDSQSGFAAIEAVLILIIVAMVGGTGYYVWHVKQNADKSLSDTAKLQPAAAKKSKQTKTTSTPDETTGWLFYEPPGKEYTMRLADGWKLNHCNGSPYLYTYQHDDVILRAGQKAVVKDINCGSDGGGDGLGIGFSTKLSEVTPTFPQTSTFKTNEGLTVQVFTHVEDRNAGGLGALDKGGTYYNYLINKSAMKTVYIGYGVNPGQTDDHETLEKAIKTIAIN